MSGPWLVEGTAAVSVASAILALVTRLDRSVRWGAVGDAGDPAPVPILARLARAFPSLVGPANPRRRRRRLEAEVPLFLDVMAAATSAGLTAQAALRRAASAVEAPLAEELETMLGAVDLGARWRDEVRRTTDRLGIPELSRLTATISRTETLGSPLAEALARLSSQVREARRVRASERARTAPVKMLFPLVFLVLPAFLLLTVVPVLLATVRSLM